jgi:phage FluMu protein gp41
MKKMVNGVLMDMTEDEIAAHSARMPSDADTLAQAKVAAGAALIAWSNAVTAAITGPVPLAEMLSWSAKETAARAMLNASASDADAAMIGAEAAVTRADPLELSQRIIANADAYRQAIAALTGLRLQALKAIAAADTPDAVQAAVAAAQAAWAA